MLAQEFRAARAAVGFLTRVPLRAAVDAVDVRRAALYFPFVGAGAGALGGACARRWGPAPALAFTTLLTGALHLDALADSADALGSRDRERALAIMRDSRIGAFGTAAICLDLMLRNEALGRLEDPVAAGATAGALSRAVPVLLAALLPYARSSGTGQAVADSGPARALLAGVAAVAIAQRTAGAAAGPVAIAAGLTVASAAFWQRKLGGITGDGLGASIELSEVAILLWSAR